MKYLISHCIAILLYFPTAPAQISIDLYRHVIGGKVHISTIYPSWWELNTLAYGRLFKKVAGVKLV